MRNRAPISASALALTACLGLLAAPPTTVRAAAAAAPADAATSVRLADARRDLGEMLDTLREAVRRDRVRPAADRPMSSPTRLASTALPNEAGDAAPAPGPPALAASLVRLLNLPPPVAA